MPSIDEVIKNCDNYIKVLRQGEKGCFLTRSVHETISDIQHESYSVVEREPRDMPLEYHKAINEHFLSIFGWPVRNGLFSFGVKSNYSKLSNQGYGTPYLLFPCGPFSYAYDPDKFDLYGSLNEYKNEKGELLMQSFLNSIHYTDSGINSAMSNIVHDDRSVEIMINCESFYLINMKYVDELRNRIWE